jgi:pyruvate/2-oxoglutarate dehydrogenase complex dihydrolipoamide dehydrogenase (E3) component
MDYDVVVIGIGAAGDAAARLGRELGARVAAVEQGLVGGECAYWACMPSKVLLTAAGRRAQGGDYSWERAWRRRDWMISREGLDSPSDADTAADLESAGVTLVRGPARIVGRGRVEVLVGSGGPRLLEAASIIVATGSVPVIPPIAGLEQAGYWTSREGTSLRDLPSSIVVLGGGVVGVELAQVYARFGVKTVVVEGEARILPRDHPKSSEAVAEQLREDGVELRTGVLARAVRAGGPGRIVELSDGSRVEGAQLLVAVGRRAADLRALGVEAAGATLTARGAAEPDAQLRLADGLFVAGDAAGGLQFTHVADYEGKVAARAALGQPVRADLGSVPKGTYTDPEAGAVGLTVEEARAAGIDALELSQDFATTARGLTLEAMRGHVTVVVDRQRHVLAGAFAACPGAAELIHEAALAIKVGVPLAVLADTIHAFPTAARAFGGLIADAAGQVA